MSTQGTAPKVPPTLDRALSVGLLSMCEWTLSMCEWSLNKSTSAKAPGGSGCNHIDARAHLDLGNTAHVRLAEYFRAQSITDPLPANKA